MKSTTKGKVLKGFAITIDVAAPLAATFTQFPVWVDRSSEATVSGLFLLFALLSCLPFIKQIKAYFRSPAVWVVWLVLFVFFVCLRNIINEMLIVCFVGLIANCIGTIIWKLGKNIGDNT
jgi:hypothetical protein